MRLAGLVLLTGIAVAFIVSFVLPYDAVSDVHTEIANAGISAKHWLGTDHLGRDVAHRVLAGTRAFCGPGAASAILAALAGTLLGAAAGWCGGSIAAGIRYGFTVVDSLPRFVLVLLACSIFGAGALTLAVASAVACAPALGEAVYARLDGLRRAEFVLAARAHGIPDARVLGYHLLWVNARGLVARHAAQVFGFFLVVETSLSYLGGFGVPEPTPSWGNMLAFEFGNPSGNVCAWLAPAVATILGVLATTIVGQDADVG